MGNGSIYTSTNSGANWISNSAPNLNWNSVCSSADGSRLFAMVNGGGIYTWQATPRPVLSVESSPNGILVSWLVPSMAFALQGSSDLSAGNWVEITDPKPTLNYTNLHYEVALRAAPGNRFYRLVSK